MTDTSGHSARIDDSARIVDSDVGRSTIREFVTVHDSTVGDDCEIYERTSLKKCRIGDDVVVNAGGFLENVDVEDEVQVGPNCSVVGVTHELSESGMKHHDDVFETILLREGSFVGAGSVLTPGVEIGVDSVVAAGAVVTADVGDRKLVLGSAPNQRVVDLQEWV
ncbi:DapH/DapD/GlmU-related protein [Halobium salinum]|uniref:DapH/DapD/GlmU-related protein n=1 Tax=Halobium salinum TaxID=1364940 RepID=A0ABD5PDF8_9EURY|nr:DapH/DapD/GlmU-related protein [Halobium salinum]